MSVVLRGRLGRLREAVAGVLPLYFGVFPARFAEAAISSFLAERDRWFLWAPVLIGLGIGVYFALPQEPSLRLGLGLFAASAAGLFLLPRFINLPLAVRIALLMTFWMAVGFGAAVLRTDRVAAPVLERSWTGEITGRVISISLTEQSLSVVMEPQTMSRLAPEFMPERVRFAIRVKDAHAAPGQIVRLRGHLEPPSAPVEPGGFDYGRSIWFAKLGGTGFAYTAPELLSAPQGMENWVQRLRASITERIRERIGGAAGAIASALVTGDKRVIPQEAIVALRNAGLAHVLAISGLHMMLFGGSLFWLVRAGLSLIPAIALRYPIKKWGAVAALLGASFYLVISGAEIAAQRAYIMLTLMFVAVLFDRPAISLRNVALAAIFILLWRPESLISASFQMSFSAVVALIAFYESSLARQWTARLRGFDGWQALVFWGAAYLLGLALTSLVAGSATGPVAAYHFNRIAVYSLLGNLIALPIVGTIIMPSALFALMLMPFGLEGPALWLMGQGIDAMLYVAREVTALPGASALVPSAPFYALMLFAFGGLWLCLWQRRWRFLGLVPLALSFMLWGQKERADVLIDRDGLLAAVRMQDGRMALTKRTPGYVAERWLLHDGDPRSPKEAASSDVMFCEREACVYREAGRPVIAFSRTLAALAEDCRHAEIIVSAVPLPRSLRVRCNARLVIDKFDLWRNGATSLTFDAGKINITTMREARGERPWARDPLKKQDQ